MGNVFARKPSRDPARHMLRFRRRGGLVDQEALEMTMHAAARAHNQAIRQAKARKAGRRTAQSPVVEG